MSENAAKSVVVIGAGQAGFAAAAALRKSGFAGAITLVGEEGSLPYQRPPLSKAFLLGELASERLLLKPAAFFAGENIDVVSDARVERIDRSNRIVHAGARTWRYDHVILATGSRARRLGADCGDDLDGVHYLRTQDDARDLGARLEAGNHLLVVGGGYIGLEVAAVAAKRGLKVTLLEFAERILQRVAAPSTSDYFRTLHRRHGVTIREGAGLARFCGSGRLTTAILTDGSKLAIDAAVVGVGIVPNVELAQDCGLAIDNGIRVDEFGRTSDPAIWAAGDCCSFPHRDARIRLESVPHAIEQAEAVARNIAGTSAPYAARPWFWSDQYDVKLQIAGLNAGFDRTVERSYADPIQKSIWYYRADRLIAVDAMNDARSYVIARKMLETGVSPSSAHVADASFDLKSLL